MNDALTEEKMRISGIIDDVIFTVSHATFPFRPWVIENVVESSHVVFIT
jgi:hypothetical protein